MYIFALHILPNRDSSQACVRQHMQYTRDHWQRKREISHIVGDDKYDLEMEETGYLDTEVVSTGSEIDFVSE